MTGIRKNGVTNQEGKKSMALQFISGNSISDRTAVMYETICAQACRHPDKNYIFLVPGTEAIRKMTVENLPVIVVIDSKGNNLYETAVADYLKQQE